MKLEGPMMAMNWLHEVILVVFHLYDRSFYPEDSSRISETSINDIRMNDANCSVKAFILIAGSITESKKR